ncbi:MAG: hypothetical protein IJE59_03035 [Clostridia bacterium]|nr:hypothetical protein [Clostridia bacterium]
MEIEKYLSLPIYQKKKDGEFLIKKDIVDDFPKNFGLNEYNQEEVEYATTSGTTSNRMEIIRKKGWWAEEYQRTYSNNKLLKEFWDRKLKKVIFTTAQCSNLICFMDKLPMEKRIINNTLYVNSTFNPWTWTKEDIIQITEEINQYQPYYMDADPVYLAIYLFLYKKYEIKEPIYIPKVITLSYEYVNKNIRKYIEDNYNTTILNLYGTTEFGYAFLEDEEGKMKLCPDLLDVKLEPVNIEQDVYALVIDSIKNEYMPLINYRVGDMVIATKEELNNFKEKRQITRMAGREKDYEKVKIPVTIIDDIFSEFKDILIYQLQYISNDNMVIKYETKEGRELSEMEEQMLKDKIEKLEIGKVQVKHVQAISPERSGKFAIIKFWEE